VAALVVESHQPDHAARCASQCLLALQSGPSPPLAVSADITQIASVLGFDGGPRQVVRQARIRQAEATVGVGDARPRRRSARRLLAGSTDLLRMVLPRHWPLHGLLRSGRRHGRSPQAIDRRRIAAKSARGTATSASWKTTYRPCRTIRAPILTNLSRKVVSDHCSTSCGKVSERRKLARL
jgi:hypothetical protein